MGTKIDPYDVIGNVSREMEEISAQVTAVLFLAKPASETKNDKLSRETFEAYICGITEHIKRLVDDCDACFLES